MKRNYVSRAAALLFALAVVSTGLLSMTLAKYTRQFEGQATLRVARFEVWAGNREIMGVTTGGYVEPNDVLANAKQNDSFTINLANTVADNANKDANNHDSAASRMINETHVSGADTVNNVDASVIAPGTHGYISFYVGSNAETDTGYLLSFEEDISNPLNFFKTAKTASGNLDNPTTFEEDAAASGTILGETTAEYNNRYANRLQSINATVPLLFQVIKNPGWSENERVINGTVGSNADALSPADSAGATPSGWITANDLVAAVHAAKRAAAQNRFGDDNTKGVLDGDLNSSTLDSALGITSVSTIYHRTAALKFAKRLSGYFNYSNDPTNTKPNLASGRADVIVLHWYWPWQGVTLSGTTVQDPWTRTDNPKSGELLPTATVSPNPSLETDAVDNNPKVASGPNLLDTYFGTGAVNNVQFSGRVAFFQTDIRLP
jgi:hypothetical protein